MSDESQTKILDEIRKNHPRPWRIAQRDATHADWCVRDRDGATVWTCANRVIAEAFLFAGNGEPEAAQDIGVMRPAGPADWSRALNDKEAEIAKLKADIAEKEDRIETQNKHLEDYHHRAAGQKDTIERFQTEIQHLRALSEKLYLDRVLIGTVAEKDRTLALHFKHAAEEALADTVGRGEIRARHSPEYRFIREKIMEGEVLDPVVDAERARTVARIEGCDMEKIDEVLAEMKNGKHNISLVVRAREVAKARQARQEQQRWAPSKTTIHLASDEEEKEPKT